MRAWQKTPTKTGTAFGKAWNWGDTVGIGISLTKGASITIEAFINGVSVGTAIYHGIPSLLAMFPAMSLATCAQGNWVFHFGGAGDALKHEYQGYKPIGQAQLATPICMGYLKTYRVDRGHSAMGQ